MNRRPSARGFALLPVILTLAMLGVIAALVLERGGVAASVTASEQRADAQIYAAEGAYSHAKALLGLQGGCAAFPTLSNAPFGAFTYSATYTPGATVPGPLLLFQSVADSWLKSADDDANFGNDNDLRNKRKTGDHEETIIRFDLSSLPADLDIESATLYLYVKSRDTSGSPIEIFRIDSAWAEGTASWDNEGTDYDSDLVQGSFVTSATGTLGTDVTRLVRQWVSAAAPNYGLRLVSTSNDRESVYGSREEGNAFERPWLHVVVRETTRVTIESTVVDSGGAARTVERIVNGPADGAVVLDAFNTGFDGSHGTRPWNGNWQEIGESNGAGAGAVRNSSDARCAYGNCLRIDAGPLSTAGAWRALSFNGASSATLRVHTRRAGGNWTLQVSGNGGSTWQTLKTAGNGTDSRQVRDSFNVTTYATANMRLRFTSTQILGLGTKDVYIDDVEVEATCPP